VATTAAAGHANQGRTPRPRRLRPTVGLDERGSRGFAVGNSF